MIDTITRVISPIPLPFPNPILIPTMKKVQFQFHCHNRYQCQEESMNNNVEGQSSTLDARSSDDKGGDIS